MEQLQPAVVVMDISLPDVSGIEAARRMLAREPALRILMFSMHEEAIFASRALQAGGHVVANMHGDVDDVLGLPDVVALLARRVHDGPVAMLQVLHGDHRRRHRRQDVGAERRVEPGLRVLLAADGFDLVVAWYDAAAIANALGTARLD